jgi:hypothetical protein
MNIEAQTLAAELLDALYRLINARVAELLKPLEAELQLVKSLQDEWVDTKTALRITGLKKAQTLKAERERPGTLVAVKFEGEMSNTPRYSRASLLAYNDKKSKSRVTGWPPSGRR